MTNTSSSMVNFERIGSDCITVITSFLSDFKSIQFLTCGNQILNLGYLQKLELKSEYNEIQLKQFLLLQNKSQPIMRRIRVSDLFFKPIDQLHLPLSLQKLTFCSWYQSIEQLQLPPFLQELHFGPLFNQPINQLYFPDSLKILTFGANFNQSIDQLVLPSSLQALILGLKFNQPVDKLRLPCSLQILRMDREFDQSINELQFPLSLQEFTYGGYWENPTSFIFDSKKSDIKLDRIRFRSCLRRLTFAQNFKSPVNELQLPFGLEHISFNVDFNQSLNQFHFPSTLRTITLGRNYNQSLNEVRFPKSLQRLWQANGQEGWTDLFQQLSEKNKMASRKRTLAETNFNERAEPKQRVESFSIIDAFFQTEA